MELYTFLRGFADSWALLALFLFFVGVVVMVFRPGSSAGHKSAADIPFRESEIDRETIQARKAQAEENT